MMERPALNDTMTSTEFKSYYYLKEELLLFCRRHNLQAVGGKLEITKRASLATIVMREGIWQNL